MLWPLFGDVTRTLSAPPSSGVLGRYVLTELAACVLDLGKYRHEGVDDPRVKRLAALLLEEREDTPIDHREGRLIPIFNCGLRRDFARKMETIHGNAKVPADWDRDTNERHDASAAECTWTIVFARTSCPRT
ncbi:MAG: hypothetical protein ACI9KE_003877 [Polyangiales bacterium]|jgi:hypothetical protein